ncbi:MAG: alginate export family protein, partial [Nitrospirota bacterium]
LAVLTTSSGANTTNTGIANTTYYNLGVDFSPMKELTLSLDGFLLYATETDAWEAAVGDSVDDSLGTEIDFKGTYKITKNLSYFVEAGWFDAGDFYDDIGAEDEDVTQLVHGLLFTF